MKKQKLSRIRYYEETDSYILELSINSGKSWDYSVGCRCVPCEYSNQPQWVHYSILEELNKVVQQGFQFVY